MLKQILELNGAKKLKKKELSEINGGGGNTCSLPTKWCRYGHFDHPLLGDVCCGRIKPDDGVLMP